MLHTQSLTGCAIRASGPLAAVKIVPHMIFHSSQAMHALLSQHDSSPSVGCPISLASQKCWLLSRLAR